MVKCDVFCRVIDNYGDAGVAWRLCQSLQREEAFCVRLVIDNLATLAAFVPEVDARAADQTVSGIEILRWDETAEKGLNPADCVIEAFSCFLPESYEAKIAQNFEQGRPVSVVALDYLTAEDYAAERHGLPSPHPRYGYPKRFFFPGFSRETGGIFLERDYAARKANFGKNEQKAFLTRFGVQGTPTLFLFTYPTVNLEGLAASLVQTGLTYQVLLAPGEASEVFLKALATQVNHNIRPVRLPMIPQREFDALLWSCDALIVRGEDSASRAMLSGKPFLWTLYPQADAIHLQKMQAFEKTLQGYYPPAALAVRNQLETALNAGQAPGPVLLRQWLLQQEQHAKASQNYASHLLTLPRVSEEITKMLLKGLK